MYGVYCDLLGFVVMYGRILKKRRKAAPLDKIYPSSAKVLRADMVLVFSLVQ